MLTTYIDRVLRKRHPAPSRAEIQAEVETRHASFGRAMARRFTRGSVSIQDDRFLMEEDLQARHGSDTRK
jgi:hypothetical protein